MILQKGTDMDLIATLHSLKNKLGYEALSVKLKELDSVICDDYEEGIKHKIIDEVCSCLSIDKNHMMDFSNKKRDEERQMGITFICAILKEHFDFDLNKIKGIFSIHESNVSRRITYIRTLDKKNKFDLIVIQKYESIIEKLKGKKIIR